MEAVERYYDKLRMMEQRALERSISSAEDCTAWPMLSWQAEGSKRKAMKVGADGTARVISGTQPSTCPKACNVGQLRDENADGVRLESGGLVS